RKRHKKIMKISKGDYGPPYPVLPVAKQAVIKAGQYANRDRRQKKPQNRAQTNAPINTPTPENRHTNNPYKTAHKKTN
ncbi:50S ribosomal protein L20, partial [Pseudomonas syringae group genomosp. 7]|uniref:50S ribosomal protein L20 n=1 Tax=Pseudomonas syringae group genomosp. 7 TaxID=251699 RepID=UPI00376FCDCD